MSFRQQNINALADYFALGCKEEKLLGLELEHFAADKRTRLSIPYDNGVERLLERFHSAYGGEPIVSRGRIIGIVHEDSKLTLEPGGQLEIGIIPMADIHKIAQAYRVFESRATPILDEMGWELFCAGYLPRSKAADMPLIPCQRYEYMNTYFSATGTRGINMMRGSAATQVSIDYRDEADFSKKYRVACILGPLFALACDNTPLFEGRPLRMARTYIWNDVDPTRSLIAAGSLDGKFGFREYASFVYEIAPIFLNGDYTGAAPASALFQDRAMTQGEMEHLTSMVFTDVRVKNCLEIRMADSMPIAPALEYTQVLKNIFYDEPTLNTFHEMTQDVSTRDVLSARNALMAEGSEAVVYGRHTKSWLADIFKGADEYEKFEQSLRDAGTRTL